MPGKRKRLSNVSPMPAYYTNTGGYNLPPVEIRGRAPQWAREQNYYDQLANFYADRFDVNGNNSRLPEIIGRAKANPEFWNEDGSLNQKGNAYITQQKHFGVGSNYYNRMNEYAKQTAYGLAQVAGAPYLAGLTGRQLLGSTIGGTIGSIEGSEIGKRFDNPATGNYAGSELGALLGGLAGGAIGGNVKPLFRKYIKGMTKLDQAQTRYWDKKELNQLLNSKPTVAEIEAISSKPTTKIRTKIGDIEIDDPTLSYRQGTSNIIDDFYKTGKVSTPEGNYGRKYIETKLGRFNFGKNFDNPMFKQGSLWYGLDPKKPGLLITKEPLALASKSSAIVDNVANGTPDIYNVEKLAGRRVPMTENQLNTNNTIGYKYVPDYGYRKVVRTNPRTSLRFLERPSKLSKLEKQGIPKNERKNPISNRITPSWYRRNNIVPQSERPLPTHLTDKEYNDLINRSVDAGYEYYYSPTYERRGYTNDLNFDAFQYGIDKAKNNVIPNRSTNIIPEKALNEFANRNEVLKVLDKYADAAQRDYINWQQSELAEHNYGGTDTDAMLGLTKSADARLKQSSKVLENMRKDYPFLKKFGNPWNLIDDYKFNTELYDDIFTHGLETNNRVISPDLDNWMTDFYENPSDFETGNLSDAIFHRKYGGPTQKLSKGKTPKKRYGGSLRRRLESGGYLSY